MSSCSVRQLLWPTAALSGSCSGRQLLGPTAVTIACPLPPQRPRTPPRHRRLGVALCCRVKRRLSPQRRCLWQLPPMSPPAVLVVVLLLLLLPNCVQPPRAASTQQAARAKKMAAHLEYAATCVNRCRQLDMAAAGIDQLFVLTAGCGQIMWCVAVRSSCWLPCMRAGLGHQCRAAATRPETAINAVTTTSTAGAAKMAAVAAVANVYAAAVAAAVVAAAHSTQRPHVRGPVPDGHPDHPSAAADSRRPTDAPLAPPVVRTVPSRPHPKLSAGRPSLLLQEAATVRRVRLRRLGSHNPVQQVSCDRHG